MASIVYHYAFWIYSLLIMLIRLLKEIFKANAPMGAGSPFVLRAEYQRGAQIIAFAAPSQGGALKSHLLENLKPFEDLAKSTVIIDLSQDGWLDELIVALREPVWFAVSHFGAGEVVSLADGQVINPWLDGCVPFLRIYGDLPAYFPFRHLQGFNNSVNVYAHPEHYDFFVKRMSAPILSMCMDTCLFDERPESDVDFLKKAKHGKLIFLKNGNSPVALKSYWLRHLPKKISTVLMLLAESLDGALDVSVDLYECVCDAFAESKISIHNNHKLIFFMCAQLDDYMRRVKSNMLANVLLDYPVVIRGANWSHVDFSGKSAIYDPGCDYEGSRSLIDDALAIVDMSPNVLKAPHDRVLRAAGRYTTFFSNKQDFYLDNFCFHEKFTFNFDVESIRERIEYALLNAQDVVEMGREQAITMRKLLTTRDYVEGILGAVDTSVMINSARPVGTQDFVLY
ncbi:hypothetical protein GCM10028811_04350 [Uliginosibacterium sediminicola]